MQITVPLTVTHTHRLRQIQAYLILLCFTDTQFLQIEGLWQHCIVRWWLAFCGFLTVLRLHCCMGFSLVAAHGFLIVVASLVEHVLQGAQALVVAAHGLSSCSSQALEHRLSGWVLGLSCSEARGIFPGQGLSLSLLHLQVDSFPLNHQGSAWLAFFNSVF